MLERQEPVDDGDVRAGQIVRLAGRTEAPRPRLAWSPWARGLALGIALGIALGMALGALAVMHVIDSHLEKLERNLKGPVYPTNQEKR